MLDTEEMIKYVVNPNVIEQVACLETALRAIERLRVETPARILGER
jgi:hypothetical protein